jgi:hypothetical protein
VANPADWRIFLASFLISNAYWILACYMGISLVEWLCQAVIGVV